MFVRTRVAADSDHHLDSLSRLPNVHAMVMAAHVPYDVWVDILGSVEETKDLAHCARVNSLVSQAALPVLYRTIVVKYVDLDGRTGVSMVRVQACCYSSWLTTTA